jgi:hypothetical protein
LAAAEKCPQFVLLPLLRNAQKRNKTKRAKQPWEGKKTEEIKPKSFVMSPDGFFSF